MNISAYVSRHVFCRLTANTSFQSKGPFLCKTFTLASLFFQDTFSAIRLGNLISVKLWTQRAPSFVKLLPLFDCFSRHVFCHLTGKPHLSQTLSQRAPSFVLLLEERKECLKQFEVRHLILLFSCLDFALKRTSEITFLQEYFIPE